MKKLRLKALSLGAKEILNREQLKSIYGGFDGSGSDTGGGPVGGGCDGGPVTYHCQNYGSSGATGHYFDCCTLNYADWQCAEAASQSDPWNPGYACSEA